MNCKHQSPDVIRKSIAARLGIAANVITFGSTDRAMKEIEGACSDIRELIDLTSAPTDVLVAKPAQFSDRDYVAAQPPTHPYPEQIPTSQFAEAVGLTGTGRRRAIISEVQAAVCKDRQEAYGDAEDNFATIAEFWTTYMERRGMLSKGCRVQPFDVAAMSTLIKIARAAKSPKHVDNWVDGAGYQVCGGGIAMGLNGK